MRAVQHPSVLVTAVADPDIRARLVFQKPGKIFGGHARQPVALDVGIAD
jgi:hypothetical protein